LKWLKALKELIPPQTTVTGALDASKFNDTQTKAVVDAATRLLFMGVSDAFLLDHDKINNMLQTHAPND
jgi:hypothetical protein